MKKNLSVVSLFLRSGIYKSLVIIFAMLALQGIMLFINLQSPVLSLEELADNMHMKLIFMAAGIIISAVLSFNFYEIASSYTARKLKSSPKEVYFSQFVSGTLIFVIWYFAEVLFAIITGIFYVTYEKPEFITSQTLILAFYRSDILHFLLPLKDIALVLRNVLIILALGFAAAVLPSDKTALGISQGITPVFIAAASVKSFGDSANYISIPILLLFIFYHTARGLRKDTDYEILQQD